MNRQDYLAALEKALKSAGMRDYEDIIEEYSEHFDMKISDGYGEEEIAARLATPEEIAGQFKEIGSQADSKKRSSGGSIIGRVFKDIGVITQDLVMVPNFIALYSWVFALAVSAIAIFASGITLITRLDKLPFISPYVHMPSMPFICALLLGVALIALSVLCAIATEHSRLGTNQAIRKYIRWHKNVMSKGPSLPPIPLNPWITPKKRRNMRTLTMVSLFVFIVGLVASMISMIALSGSLEPWHAWNWFV